MSNSSLTIEEYVLDYVIERKSIEDLLHSVRDGNRYHSQKYRLQQCGLRHLYYLVEGDVESLSSSTDYKVVSTACTKTSAIDGFNVLRPKSFAETLVLYSRMTSSIRDRVRRMFKSADRNLDGAREWARASGLMTFAEFQARNVRLEKDANCARDIWTVMLNEVPGIGKVAVEGRIFSDPRHRTCHGFYSDACRDGRELERTANSNKVESVRSFLFF
jgi:ERCC4-type nuclease